MLQLLDRLTWKDRASCMSSTALDSIQKGLQRFPGCQIPKPIPPSRRDHPGWEHHGVGDLARYLKTAHPPGIRSEHTSAEVESVCTVSDFGGGVALVLV